jgi:hypothetical protein
MDVFPVFRRTYGFYEWKLSNIQAQLAPKARLDFPLANKHKAPPNQTNIYKSQNKRFSELKFFKVLWTLLRDQACRFISIQCFFFQNSRFSPVFAIFEWETSRKVQNSINKSVFYQLVWSRRRKKWCWSMIDDHVWPSMSEENRKNCVLERCSYFNK